MNELERAGVISRKMIRAVLEPRKLRWVRPMLRQWTGKMETAAFLNRLPALEAVLRGDIQAALEGDPAAQNEAEVIAAYPGFHAVAVQRLAHVLWELGVPLLPRLMTEHAHSATGIDIHPGAKLGKRLFIDHGTGVVIGETAVIGDRVKLYQGVTLGGVSTRDAMGLRGKKRHPTIGNDVTIYANATILGGDTVIGDGCTIGANVFLTGSVAPGTTVRMKDQKLEFQER